MVTALSDSKSLQEGFISGANWYITKPYDEAELEMILNDMRILLHVTAFTHNKPIKCLFSINCTHLLGIIFWAHILAHMRSF